MSQEHNISENSRDSTVLYDPAVILRDVARRWYMILAAAILAGMTAFMVVAETYVPRYTASATFVVNQQTSSASVFQNLSAANSLATVFSEVLNSSLMRDTIEETLEISGFSGTITAQPVAETNLLTLRVTDSSPRTAFLVARAIVDHHTAVSRQVMGDTILEVLQQPTVPMVPSNPMNAARRAKQSFLIGGVAMAVLLGALSSMRDTVRSATEAESKLEIRVLGELYHEKKHRRRGLREMGKKSGILITMPTTSLSYVEHIRKLRRRIELHMPENGKVLLIAGVLENEGKSTVAVNLALAMAQKGNRVLLIDGDMRRPALWKLLELTDSGPMLSDVLDGRTSLKEAIRVSGKQEGLDVLPGRKSGEHQANPVESVAMGALLREARNSYDMVIVDTPPISVSTDVECLAELVDATALVIRQNDTPVRLLNRSLDMLAEAGAPCIGCILNDMCTPMLMKITGGGHGYGHGYGYGYGYGYGGYYRYGSYGKNAEKAGGDHEAR